MRSIRSGLSMVLATALLLGLAGAAVAKSDRVPGFAGQRFTTTLLGINEFPDSGDPDGSGTATVVLNSGQGTICWYLTVSGIAPATAAHIHEAPAGSAGGVVLPLSAPTDGDSSGCADDQDALIAEIRANPEDYYVNVHNLDYPGGALRGQLG